MKFVLLRDLPGSGKTTIAASFAEFAYFETEQFFVEEDGIYRYWHDRIHEAHTWCPQRARNALASRKVLFPLMYYSHDALVITRKNRVR